ncbi:MAG: peptidase M61 [Bacteroidetes bacterium]|nr:peptidase M61 [Bacteroidota bacterium]
MIYSKNLFKSNLLLFFFLPIFLWAQNASVEVQIDLQNTTDDQVAVSVQNPAFKTDIVQYKIPKIIPGTYSISDFGKYIASFRAYDRKDNLLPVTKVGDNVWEIEQAKKLTKISYLVNDTYDMEDQHDIFSPGGSNILADQNFMLNLHAFVGYFEGFSEVPYNLTVLHPESLYGSTATIDADNSPTKDVFKYDRYFTVTDNPILYSKADTLSFKVNNIKVELAVYSPNDLHNAEELREPMMKMMQAQKKFLGDVNTTDIYSILLYFSQTTPDDAQGFGALEHHNATVVVLPEAMEGERLISTMVDVVSHEFFHILTPLSVHSEEIHFFDFNEPKMSQHLWMYEGVTEYFANLFQVQEGLITEQDFYDRMMDKLYNSLNYNDTLSFTEMSARILEDPYKDHYPNVYEKGAIIGMCIDLIIRDKSQSQRGILDVMKELSARYGAQKPFKDDALLEEFTALSYPEVGDFFNRYVKGNAQIPYNEFLDLAGVSFVNKEVPGGFFLDGNMPYIGVSELDNISLFFLPNATQNKGLKAMGVEPGDILKSVNGVSYNIQNVYDLVIASESWEAGQDITVQVLRNQEELNLTSKIELPMVEITVLEAETLTADDPKVQIRKAWLGLE